MGAGRASGRLERGDAERLIDVAERQRAGIDISDPVRSVAAWIEIGVEHALVASKLQLQAVAFADLERRSAEPANKLFGGEADDLAPGMGRLRDFGDGLRRRTSLRGRGAGSDEQGERYD